MPNDALDVLVRPVVPVTDTASQQRNSVDFVFIQKAIFGECAKPEPARIPVAEKNKLLAKWVRHEGDFALDVSALTGFGRLSWLLTTREDVSKIINQGVIPTITREQIVTTEKQRCEERGRENDRKLMELNDKHNRMHFKLGG